MFPMTFDHYWRVRSRFADRQYHFCRVLVYGKLNNVLVQFSDGFLTVTSRNYVRKRGGLYAARKKTKQSEKRGIRDRN